MTNSVTASAEVTPVKKTRSNGEIALSKISIAWKGNSLEAARTAAFEIGKLAAGGWLAYHKADDFWKSRFTVQLGSVENQDSPWRLGVIQAFDG